MHEPKNTTPTRRQMGVLRVNTDSSARLGQGIQTGPTTPRQRSQRTDASSQMHHLPPTASPIDFLDSLQSYLGSSPITKETLQTARQPQQRKNSANPESALLIKSWIDSLSFPPSSPSSETSKYSIHNTPPIIRRDSGASVGRRSSLEDSSYKDQRRGSLPEHSNPHVELSINRSATKQDTSSLLSLLDAQIAELNADIQEFDSHSPKHFPPRSHSKLPSSTQISQPLQQLVDELDRLVPKRKTYTKA